MRISESVERRCSKRRRLAECLWAAGLAIFLGLAPCLVCAATATPAPGTVADPGQSAARIDSLLAQEHYGAKEQSETFQPIRIVDDETFLRRVSLDLIGALPAPEEVTRFALDSQPNKRSAVVERLLADKQYGQNWARYWRDVIFYRRKEERALLAAPALTVWMAEALNADQHWDQIAKAIVTATGDVRETGPTGLILSQLADPNDTAAEVSRIFLGIQIQCAQCHDHPTDHWKREQFHQFAAFFPRIGIRPDRGGEKRSFDVVSINRPHQKRAPGSQEEVTLEHYMPDLKQPKEQGKLMQPVFFATGQQLAFGLSDQERRAELALWMTSGEDRWFAKAFVNRMWSELVGRGFCEPIDDMGPDRQPLAEQTFEALASDFIASRYDVKWLLRTIIATTAYQRESPRRTAADLPPLAASYSQPLRADQLFNVLCDALDIDEAAITARGEPGGKKMGDGALRYFAGPRGQVNRVFGYDPSTRRDEVAGSIPQALWMMNAGVLNRAMSAHQPDSMLAQLLAKQPDNDQVVLELYLRLLAREPKAGELASCREYIAAAGDRKVAFEDILWSLVNSTEFLHRK